MTLFEECLVALEKGAVVLPNDETKKLFKDMISKFPLTSLGKLDLKKIKHVVKISSKNEIMKHVVTKQQEIYVLWDEASLPAIKTNISNVLNAIDDVTAVSFDTWIYSPACGYVIEFYHENEINIGWI